MYYNEDKKNIKKIIKSCIDSNNLPIEIVKTGQNSNYSKCDSIINMKIRKEQMKYCCLYKKNINKAMIGFLIEKKQQEEPILLITEYVNNNLAEKLRNNQIEFMDLAGNVFLSMDSGFIYVKGNKLSNNTKSSRRSSFMNTAGIKTIFTLLSIKDSVNFTYRKIAKETGVSLGTVSNVLEDLKERGFIIEKKGTRRLINKNSLVKRWSLSYNEVLKPKLLIDVYKGPKGWWEEAKDNLQFGIWSGEVAGTILADYMKPSEITIYIDADKLTELCLNYKLRKDENGNVRIFEKFWKSGRMNKHNTVHPILIYADLIGTAEQRNVEMAQLIYEKFID